MAKAIYDNRRIIPVVSLDIQKTYQTTDDMEKVGSTFNITIHGVIFAYKGSPNSSGVFYSGGGYYEPDGRVAPTYMETLTDNSRFAAIVRKQEALRQLFANEGRQLEFQSFDGSAPMKCNPRNFSITFEGDRWYDTCNYTVTCECDVLYINGTAVGEDNFSQYIGSADENWSIEAQEEPENENIPRTYRLTHSINAKGKRFYKPDGSLLSPAWKQARDWVVPRLGLDGTYLTSSGLKDLPPYLQGYNHLRTENIDETGGTYSVTETWLLASGGALEDFNINTNIVDGLVTVSIDGSIRGLELRDSNLNLQNTKWTNALYKFNQASGVALARAQAYSGYVLNSVPISLVVGKNPVTGTITYTTEYNNRPTLLLTGTKSEVIAINDSFDIDVFAAIPVLGRAAGPVLQNIGTHRETTRSLSIEAVFGPDYASSGTLAQRLNAYNPRFKSPTTAELQAIVDAAHPVNAGLTNNAGQTATIAYVSDQSFNWEPNQGRLSYNVTWVWE